MIIFIFKYGYMWLHKSRSISNRKERGKIVAFENHFFITNSNNVFEETNINSFLQNKIIDVNNPFLIKIILNETTLHNINLFKLDVENIHNDFLCIGIINNPKIENILGIEKNNSCEYYSLIPYFKINKSNLETGTHITRDSQMSYCIGLFKVNFKKEDIYCNNQIENMQLIDNVILNDNITFKEYLNNFNRYSFEENMFFYILMGVDSYCMFSILTNSLKKTTYFIDISNINIPKITNVNLKNKSLLSYNLVFNKGRCEFKDESENGKNAQIHMQNNPYYNSRIQNWLSKNNSIFGSQLQDLAKNNENIAILKSHKRDIIFCYTPFNNLNMIYVNNKSRLRTLFYEYYLSASLKKNLNTGKFDNVRYSFSKLNPKNINSKYKINENYKNYYHNYLYFLYENIFEQVPYIQVFESKDTKEIYGCILNMKGKLGVFDKKIIIE